MAQGAEKMTSVELTRRSVLASVGGFAIAASLWSLAQEIGLSDQRRRHLLEMARRIYPHSALPDEVYVDSLESLYDSAIDNANLKKLMREGMEALDTAAGGNWAAASHDDQIIALTEVENSEFFATVQEEAREALYQHPAVWALIGYEGSSVEFGGYIERGFDDIDWLPDD